MASYLTAAAFLVRADVASVSRLCSRHAPVTAANLLTDPILAAALLDASGLVLSAVTAGDTFTDGDLTGLTGTAQAFLFRLVACLTVCLLWEDRMMYGGGGGDLPQPIFYEAAYDELARLQRGEKLFAV